MMRRRLTRWSLAIPPWLAWPVFILGLAFPVLAIVHRDWGVVVVAVIWACLSALYIGRKYETRAIKKTDDGIVYEFRRKGTSSSFTDAEGEPGNDEVPGGLAASYDRALEGAGAMSFPRRSDEPLP